MTKDSAQHPLRLKIFDCILAASDGATCDEVEAALGILHQTASARVRELVKGKFIFYSGRKRKTRAGRPARIYFIYYPTKTS